MRWVSFCATRRLRGANPPARCCICSRQFLALSVHQAEPSWQVALEIWLVMHKSLRDSPRLRAAFDNLSAALSI
jgi:hypothetical protein